MRNLINKGALNDLLIFSALLFCFITGVSLDAKKHDTLPRPHKKKHEEKTVTLTMQEAVEIAFNNKPNLQAYKHAVEESKMRGKQVWSAYFPQVNISSNFQEYRHQKHLKNTTSISAQQLVFDFAGPIEQYKKAKKATHIVELMSEQDKKFVRHEVEKSFLECWQFQQQYRAIKSLQKSSTTTFKKAAHENKLQLLDKSEWLKQNSIHAVNLATIQNYLDDMELTQKKLEFFLGQPINLQIFSPHHSHEKKSSSLPVKLVWDEKPRFEAKHLDYYQSLALKNRDELKITSARVNIAKDDIRIASRSNLPTVNVFANAGYSETPTIFSSKIIDHGWHAFGATVNWNIFDGFLNGYKSNEAHAAMLKEMLTNQQNAQTIKFDVEKSYYAFSKAIATLRAQKTVFGQTKNDFKLKQQEFKIGTIAKVEFEQAKTIWENARINWLNAKIDAAIKERTLAFSCGYPKALSQ